MDWMADMKRKAELSFENPQENIHNHISEHFIADIELGIKGEIGKRILFYENVDSTNTVAAELAERGAQEGTVVLADSQEKGKGRIGRYWVSPPGVNIYMSIISRPEIKIREGQLLTMMASIGCAKALKRVTGLTVTLKWSNDLMVSGRKIGGILAEMKTLSGKIIYAITGIGINVNMELDSLPEDIKETATSIKNETGVTHSRKTIIVEILNEIDYWYRTFREKGKGILLSEWKKLASDLGKEVKVTDGKKVIKGLAESIDEEGRLILKLASGEFRKLRAGDVTIVK